MSEVTGPENCPEREFHGKWFRYCGVKGCGWAEPSKPKPPSPEVRQARADAFDAAADLIDAGSTTADLRIAADLIRTEQVSGDE